MEPVEFTIREVADRFGVSLRTLRFYEQCGLLAPRRIASNNNARMYSEDQAKRAGHIIAYSRAGVPIEKIGGILDIADVSARRAALRPLLDIAEAEARERLDAIYTAWMGTV